MDIVRKSKTLSSVLRHRAASYGLTLDPQGWIAIDELLPALAKRGRRMSRGELDRVVAENDKQRFEFSVDRTRIRARQGHTVEVDLALPPAAPPPTLYHGTFAKALDSIRREGLTKQTRHHVHLSPDEATAAKVGARRGRPVILTIDTAAMARDGHEFFLTGNAVWLTDAVPANYIRFPAETPPAPRRT